MAHSALAYADDEFDLPPEPDSPPAMPLRRQILGRPLRWSGSLESGIMILDPGGASLDQVALSPEPENPSVVFISLGGTSGSAAVLRPTSDARLQMERLKALSPGWDDESPVPNETAFRHAEEILGVLDDSLLSPERVVPNAEGGVSIYFFGASTLPGGARRRYASISCSNDGEVVALTHDREGEPEALSIDVKRMELLATADLIRRFISA